MSPATKQHGADPWWGIEPPATPPPSIPPATPPGRRRGPRRRGARGSRRSGIGWLLLGLLLAPIDLLRRLVRRSPRLRRLLVRAAVLVAVLTVLACSVGVILINNVVIGRTAELGELEDRRRELRRENAVLGAQAARLESPELVRRRATKELGMVPTSEVPQFVYLFDGSRTITPHQRRQIAARAERRRAAVAEQATDPSPAATATAEEAP